MKTSVLTSLALRAVLRPTMIIGAVAILALPALGMISLSRYGVDAPP